MKHMQFCWLYLNVYLFSRIILCPLGNFML